MRLPQPFCSVPEIRVKTITRRDRLISEKRVPITSVTIVIDDPRREGFLALVVIVKGALWNARVLGDVLHAGSVESLLMKELQGGGEDLGRNVGASHVENIGSVVCLMRRIIAMPRDKTQVGQWPCARTAQSGKLHSLDVNGDQ
jgi:hypothetical protein